MNKINIETFKLMQLLNPRAEKFFKNRNITRNLWLVSKGQSYCHSTNMLYLKSLSIGCSCGCGKYSKSMHTKGERELVEFLTEEILAERKAQKNKIVPPLLDGFNVQINGASVELTKQCNKEKVVISFNVNHTVDTEEDGEMDPVVDKAMGEMRSKPQFEVDITRGCTTLSFTCSFFRGTAREGEYNDVFGIDEICIFEKEWNEKIYAVSGDVLDGYLYDLLMNLLEEKGISNEFVEKLSDLATTHEQISYIELLEKMSKFATA